MPMWGHHVSCSLFLAFIFTPLPEMGNNQSVGDISTSAGHVLFKPDHSSRGGGKKAPKRHRHGSVVTAPGWTMWLHILGLHSTPLSPVQRENLLSPSLPLPPGDAFALTLLKKLIFLGHFDCFR